MDDGADLYALLGVAAEAGEKELARAYRAKALQLHPDKNRDSPDAARLFHGVKDAYELLTDPQRRAAYDAQRRAQAAKRQRHTALSGERKRMKAQLERDERAARDAAQARAQSTHAEAARFRDEAQRAEARRDRELREHVRQAAAADAEPGAADSVFDDVEELDRSVVVRWASDCHHDRASLAAAFAAFGGVEEVVVAPVSAHARRRGETKPPSALVVFRSLAAAHALVSARPDDPRVRGFTCSWAGGAEPAAVRSIAGTPAPAAPRRSGPLRIPALADIDLRQIRGAELPFSDFESMTFPPDLHLPQHHPHMDTAAHASDAPAPNRADKAGSAATPASSAAFDDARSETSTVDTGPDDGRSSSSSSEQPDLAELAFFTRLYEIPMVNDAVSGIYRLAESNRYTSAIIRYAEKVGSLAERSRPLLRPVEKPIAALDGYATRSLELIEAHYPIVARPTDEVLESVQSQAKAVEARYPVVARTFAVAKSTANSALDRVDYLVDYVLPPSAVDSSNDDNNNEGAVETPAEAAAEGESAAAVDSPLEKVTVLVHKVPKRLGRHYYEQLQASKAAIGNLRQSVKDTVNVYESELGERSQRLLGSVQARVWSTVSAIPGCLPQFAQQYIEHGKDVLVSKAAKLHAEYSRTDEDIRTKVFNLILISGEQVPVLEEITARVFGKATAAAATAAAADECSDDEKAGSPSH
ncbi:hypothetical protein IWQ56_001469 [Coemansia nantahalensis]|nr:hypothetical protein IWQ56_001469 [Coemansia nantahalensis]